jgi:hypothetical protein
MRHNSRMNTNFLRLLAAILCPTGAMAVLSACTDTPEPQAQPAGQKIVIEAPADGQPITGTFEARGALARVPDESQIAYRLYDADGNLLASGPISVEGAAGGPGSFRDAVAFDGTEEGPGEFEIIEQAREDGTNQASAVANVYFAGPGGRAPAGPFASTSVTLDSPQEGASIGSPTRVTGEVSATPIDNLLIYRVYDTEGDLAGIGPLDVTGEVGQAGTFDGWISYTLEVSGAGRVVIVDQDPDNGIVYGRAAHNVRLSAVAQPAALPFANAIVIRVPADRARVGGVFEVAGALSAVPFEPSLMYRIYDASGALAGAGLVKPRGEPGQPGEFTASITVPAGISGAGIVEILDIDLLEGLVFSSAAVNVFFGAPGAPAAAAAPNLITIEVPLLGDVVGSPFELRGSVEKAPQSGKLAYRVYDMAGRLVGAGRVAVAGNPGGAGTFAGVMTHAATEKTAGRIQVLDLNPADSAADGLGVVEVFLSAGK